MNNLNWYVAYVRSCQERKIAERLAAQGIEVYVPVQKVKRKWSDRIKIIDKLVIPGLVFVHCDSKTRETVFNYTSGFCYFLMDRTSPTKKPMTVPEKQMTDFMRVVSVLNGEDELSLVNYTIAPGDTVRVLRGPLTGFVCECVQVQNKHNLIIRLGLLGSALVQVDISDVVKEGCRIISQDSAKYAFCPGRYQEHGL